MDKNTKLTPNVKRLLMHKVAIDAVPAGGGLADGLNFLSSKERIMSGMRDGMAWVSTALDLVRSAPDPNLWKDASDEEIATELMRRVDERKAAKKL